MKNFKNISDSIYCLTERLDVFLQKNFLSEEEKKEKIYIENQLKEMMKNFSGIKFAFAQVNNRVCDFAFNAEKIINYIKTSEAIGLDVIIFPELCLFGYPIYDVMDRFRFLVEENEKWLLKIAEKTKHVTALVGFLEKRNEKFGKTNYNSVAVLNCGKIQKIIRKSLLPNYSEFSESRYIAPFKTSGSENIFKIKDKKIGISICEDTWSDKDFFEHPKYPVDPVELIAKENPDFIINCSASPSRAKKEQLKHNMLQFISKKYKIPYIYVNQVGATDDVCFDGASRVYDKNGNLILRAKSFQEQFLIFNLENNIKKIYPLSENLEETLNEKKEFFLHFKSDLGRTKDAIVLGIGDYFHKNGLKKAVLGLSGGLDSSICAVLLSLALGKENVYGISMPSYITSEESKNDARQLAENLGIYFEEISICKFIETSNELFSDLFEKISKNWQKNQKDYTNDNIQARSRAMILWGVANRFEKTIPIATSDKSELYMGYATINGDMSGGFAPIADVCKTKLFQLGHYLNSLKETKNAIPVSILEKPPGAELAIDEKTNKPLLAEDALMPYEFLDEIIWRIENKNETFSQMLESSFLYEKKHSISAQQKRKWLEKFFSRMQNALYKWTIMPPSVLVDSKSINKAEYKQPIVSTINFLGLDN